MNWKIPKFYTSLEEHFRLAIELDKYHPFEYRNLHHLLISVNTKRMLFDSRQATVFGQSGPLGVDGLKLHSPFDQFYLEFTDPIEIDGQEPGYKDQLVAMLYIDNSSTLPILCPEGETLIDTSAVTFIFYNHETKEWVDRTWRFSTVEKLAYPSVQNIRDTANPSDVPNEWSNTKWFTSGMEIEGMPNRHIGWWEGAIQTYTNLILWMFAYMMSKSVHISSEPISRQVRRFNERHGITPRPWHQVWVDPKITDNTALPEDGNDGPDHRFDVIGHLRFNRHKLKTGSYRHTVEWVPDHQRGLKNEIYIPKVYGVKKGNKSLPEMSSYFGQKVKFDSPSKGS